VLGDRVVEAVLDDYRSAPIEGRLRAMLAFLEKVTLTPAEVTPDDADQLRAGGVSDTAAKEALHVCFVFNIFDRMADALGFHIPPKAAFEADAKYLLRVGYR
jgi:alkylhydroperoxidase family enzyme